MPSRVCQLLTVIAWSLTLSSIANAAAYIKFDGIDGECLDRGYEGWSYLSQFQIDVSIPVGSTGQAGRPDISTQFRMPIDDAYPFLQEALLTGALHSTVTVDLVDEGLLRDRYEYIEALTPSLSASYSSSGSGWLTGKLLGRSLDYTRYIYDDSTGALIDTVIISYDLNNSTQSIIAPSLAGDYNGDGRVDALDYTVWKNSVGEIPFTIGTGADGNADGIVDLADYTVWRNSLSPEAASSLSGSELVPEPATCLLAAMGLTLMLATRRRKACAA